MVVMFKKVRSGIVGIKVWDETGREQEIEGLTVGYRA